MKHNRNARKKAKQDKVIELPVPYQPWVIRRTHEIIQTNQLKALYAQPLPRKE